MEKTSMQRQNTHMKNYTYRGIYKWIKIYMEENVYEKIYTRRDIL